MENWQLGKNSIVRSVEQNDSESTKVRLINFDFLTIYLLFSVTLVLIIGKIFARCVGRWGI
jgi:hypothetical protein